MVPYDWHLAEENFGVTFLQVSGLHVALAALDVEPVDINAVLRGLSDFFLEVGSNLRVEH
jgi:hypothetical protein